MPSSDDTSGAGQRDVLDRVSRANRRRAAAGSAREGEIGKRLTRIALADRGDPDRRRSSIGLFVPIGMFGRAGW